VTHFSSAAHAVVQTPQCFASDVVSTHAPLHAVSPVLQVSAQRPPTQPTMPLGTDEHAAPH